MRKSTSNNSRELANMAVNRELNAKVPSGRVTRQSNAKRNRLTIKDKDPNFVYRIVNDIDDRISDFQARGYEFVPSDVQVGDARVNNTSSEGSYKKISVGQGVKAYVMRIKKEWYDEDRDAYNAQVNEIERATQAKAKEGTYGKLEISQGRE